MRYALDIAFISLALLFASTTVSAQKLTPEQIIARHLDSVGRAEQRYALKTLIASGASEFSSNVPVAKGGGKALVVSDPENLYFVLSLNSRDYPFEKVGAFKDKVSLPYINPGNRSLLGSFLAEHSKVLSDNLFCGAMSLRWINNISTSKMKATGTKKLNGRETFVIEVLPSGSGSVEFKIRLYFDAENFRHVRSEYRREGRVGRIVFGEQNQQAAGKVELIEEFSDFKEVDAFTLPHEYKVKFLSNSNSQMYENLWGIKVAGYYFDQKLAPDFFSFDP